MIEFKKGFTATGNIKIVGPRSLMKCGNCKFWASGSVGDFGICQHGFYVDTFFDRDDDTRMILNYEDECIQLMATPYMHRLFGCVLFEVDND